MTAPTPAPTRADDAPPTPPWGLGHVALAIAATLVVAQVVQVVVLGIAGVEVDEIDDVSLVVRTGMQVGLWLGMLGSVAVVLRLTGGTWRRDLGLRFRTWDLPAGIVVGIICQLLTRPASVPWAWALGRDLDELKEPACRLAAKADDPLGVVLFVGTVVLAAPVIEEIFYRGFAQRPAVQVLGRAFGVVAVALLFGLSHFQALQLFALFAFGLLLGVVAEWTGRLGPSIGMHMGFNATTAYVLVASNRSLESTCGDALGLVGGLVR